MDTNIRRCDGPPSMLGPQLPMTPGREVAGVIAAVGPGAERGVGEEGSSGRSGRPQCWKES